MKRSEKRKLDLLNLPQKERVRLCREIRSILQQRAMEEKDVQMRVKPEKPQLFGKREVLAKNSNSYLSRIRNSRVWNRLV